MATGWQIPAAAAGAAEDGWVHDIDVEIAWQRLGSAHLLESTGHSREIAGDALLATKVEQSAEEEGVALVRVGRLQVSHKIVGPEQRQP